MPAKTRLFRFVRAGGRCEFDGCNRYLLQHHLTKTEGRLRNPHLSYPSSNLSLYIFCGSHLLGSRLRTANQDASAGSVEELERIVAEIRERWPEVSIWVPADSGFTRDALMSWCEANDVEYVFGLARKNRLHELLEPALDDAWEL